jgi:actin-related protein 5
MSTSPENVILLPQAPLIRVPPPPEDYAIYRDKATPIVIDNGATTLRYGFAAATSPRVAPNAVSKYKERRSNKPLLVFGDGVDIESGAKSQVRTPWEGDVLLNFDALVCCSHIPIPINALNKPVEA